MKLRFGVIFDVPVPLCLLFKYQATSPITYLDENLVVRGYVTGLKPVFIPINMAQNYICYYLKFSLFTTGPSDPRHNLNFVFPPPLPLPWRYSPFWVLA
jgi:hypothetical protein